jgi:membrane protein implicated in regulation of membrane protease activity
VDGVRRRLLAIEVATGSGWILPSSASAAVVAIVAVFTGISLPVRLLVFAALTIVSTLLARRYFPRSVTADHGHDINDNIGRPGGPSRRGGRRLSPAGPGRVFIDGKEWAAELAEGDGLDAGSRVEVVGVAGRICGCGRLGFESQRFEERATRAV